jgi:hypothetical protein
MGVLLLALAVPAVPALAEEPLSGSDRLAAGVAGIVGGPAAVPDAIAAETDALGPAAGVPVGLARGVGTMVWRQSTGMVDIVRSLGDATLVQDAAQVTSLQRACGGHSLRVTATTH